MPDLTGPDQAQAMIRRVSPEGRVRAERERRRRQQRAARIALKGAGVAVAVAGALTVYAMVTGGLGTAAVMIGLAVVVGAVIAFAMTSGERSPAPAALERMPLTALPGASAQWLESQVPALPAPAAHAAESIAADLGVLGPQIAQLAGESAAGEAVRRLLAVELPALVERYRSVPAPLRAQASGGGDSADAHLANGLRIVREEVGRMSEQLARGEVDALAVQDRFLELKYQGDAMLKP